MSILVVHRRNPSRKIHLQRLHEYAQKQNQAVIVCTNDVGGATGHADSIIEVDTEDSDATLKAITSRGNDFVKSIRGVVSFVGRCVPTAADIASEFSLPGVKPGTARLLQEKVALRRTLGEAGIPQPRIAVVATLGAALDVATSWGFPVVLKPASDDDSGYFRRVDSPEELSDHFYAVLRHASVLLVEEYVAGAEFSVESVVVDSRSQVVAVHDKPLAGAGPYFVDEQYLTPSDASPTTLDSLTTVVRDAHHALGVDTGVVHTELRIRPDGTPIVLDVAARIGGGPIYQSVLLSTGVDLVAAALDMSQGRAPATSVGLRTHTGIHLPFADEGGRVASVNGTKEALADQRVRELCLYVREGEVVDVPPSTWQSYGHAVVTGVTRSDVVQAIDHLARTLSLEVEDSAPPRERTSRP